MAKIFGTFKSGVRAAFDPLGRALVRAGVSPDAVTIAGTVGVVAGSVVFAARGQLVAATVVITLCALLDVLDGAMARARGHDQPVRRPARLDHGPGRRRRHLRLRSRGGSPRTGQRLLAAVTLVCLVGGQVVSYVKARAEGARLPAATSASPSAWSA